MLALVILLGLTPARAGDTGTLVLASRAPGAAYAFVDGTKKVRLDQGGDGSLDLGPGVHEVAFGPTEQAVALFCVGSVTVAGGKTVNVSLDEHHACRGLGHDKPQSGSVLKGVRLDVSGDAGTVFVDQKKYGEVGAPGFFNLGPGEHGVKVSSDPGGSRVICEGRLKMGDGQQIHLEARAGACKGFGG